MADMHVHSDRLEIHLTAAEKVLALKREDLLIPRESIRSVAITEDPWIWIRGIRAPGAAVPLTLAIGTWKFHGGKDFLLIKGKQRAAVVIDLEGEEYSRVIVSTPHAAKLIETLRAVGFGLIFFCATCMVLAALVLLTTGRRYLRAALLQGLLPLAGLIVFTLG